MTNVRQLVKQTNAVAPRVTNLSPALDANSIGVKLIISHL